MGANGLGYTLKREKFIRLLDYLRDFNVQSKFRSDGGTKGKPHGSVLQKMDEAQNERYETLKDLWWNNKHHDYNNVLGNLPIYEEAIQDTIFLIRALLIEWVGEPIVFANGYKYDTIDEYMTQFDHFQYDNEVCESIHSSQFTCVHDGHTIMKIQKEFKEDGYSVNHIYGLVENYPVSVFPTWIQEMSRGLYTIDGLRFDIQGVYYHELTIYHEDAEKHPIKKYINQNELDEYIDDMEDAPNCSRCGDGGCVHCEPQFFM